MSREDLRNQTSDLHTPIFDAAQADGAHGEPPSTQTATDGLAVMPDASTPIPSAADVVIPAVGPTPIDGRLRKAPLRIPEGYERATGFTLFGRRIRSLLYSTDVAVIRNSNADAIFAVYPFTAQPAITQALLAVAEAPLFVGVGGGTTTGRRAAELAAVSEMQGAAGVVLNSPATSEMVAQIAASVDIPVVATITAFDDEARSKVHAGARIVNVAAGRSTCAVIAQLREAFPDLPIIATGGRNNRDADATVDAGANALIWFPPSIQQLQSDMMKKYRGLSTGATPPAAAPATSPEEQAAEPEAEVVIDVAIPETPIADVPVAVAPPEDDATPRHHKGFVSPFQGRLPLIRLFGNNGHGGGGKARRR